MTENENLLAKIQTLLDAQEFVTIQTLQDAQEMGKIQTLQDSERPKPLFWFMPNTETVIGRYFKPIL